MPIDFTSAPQVFASSSTAEKLYPKNGVTYFVVAVLPGISDLSGVFTTVVEFNKFAAQDGKDSIGERAAFYAAVIKADSSEKWPENWQNRVLPMVLPKGAGQTLATLMADPDMGYAPAYFALDGKVMKQDAEGNTLAPPTVFKMVRDTTKPAAQMYSITGLPGTASIAKVFTESDVPYELPTDTLSEFRESEAETAKRRQAQFNELGGDSPVSDGAAAPKGQTAPGTPTTRPSAASVSDEAYVAMAAQLGVTVEQIKAMLAQ